MGKAVAGDRRSNLRLGTVRDINWARCARNDYGSAISRDSTLKTVKIGRTHVSVHGDFASRRSAGKWREVGIQGLSREPIRDGGPRGRLGCGLETQHRQDGGEDGGLGFVEKVSVSMMFLIGVGGWVKISLKFQGAAPNGQPETPRKKGFWLPASQERN
jgi:hypothetical protein